MNGESPKSRPDRMTDAMAESPSDASPNATPHRAPDSTGIPASPSALRRAVRLALRRAVRPALRRAVRPALRYAAVIAVMLLVWKLLALGPAGDVLPHPEDALAAFADQLGRASFQEHIWASTLRAVAAMAIAWGLAFPLGVLMGSMPRLDAALAPFVFLTYPIPKIVLLPVFLLLLGLGETSRIAMICLILAYQILVTTRDGVKTINPKYLDTVLSLGGSYRQLLAHVLIPAALPHGFTALRLGTGTAVAVLFFVESFATQKGLGWFIMDAWGRLDFDEMFAGIFGMSALGVILYEATNALEKRACRWQRSRRGE